MSWSTRIQTSWQLLQRSFEVLRSSPRLMLFPVVSTACALALAVFFLLPIALLAWSAWPHQDWQALGNRLNGAFYAYGIAIYLVSLLIATFFNVAFYHEIMRALAGDPVSLGGGLRFAVGKLKAIVMWTLLAGTIGLVIRAIEDRLGWIGKIVMGLVGLAWSVAAVFAIPVLIRHEDSNPVAVLRDSAGTLKRTWGETLVGFAGIQLGGVAFVIAAMFFGLSLLLGALVFKSMGLVIAFAVFWLLVLMAAAFLIHMAEHVYKCALYVYASEGVIPGPFTAELMNSGWKVKKA